MEDDTMHIKKPETTRSKLFFVSVRGWIALMFCATLCLNMTAVVAASFFAAVIPQGIETALISLFSMATGAAVNEYFRYVINQGKQND